MLEAPSHLGMITINDSNFFQYHLYFDRNPTMLKKANDKLSGPEICHPRNTRTPFSLLDFHLKPHTLLLTDVIEV